MESDETKYLNNEKLSKKYLNKYSLIDKGLYKNIFEYANDAIFIMDYDKIIECNSKSVQIFGCKDKEEILGHKPIDFSPEFQPDGTSSNKKAYIYINLASKGEAQRFYWLHNKKDGSNFDCEITLNSLSKKGTNLIMAIVRDISFIKKMERQLIKLSLGVEQSPASVVITNIEGSIEYVNPKFCELTGYSSIELIGQNPRVLKTGWTSDEEYKILWDTISSGKTWKGIFRNKKKDNSLYWESAVIAPIKDSSGNIINYMGIKEDITKQKELEEQIIQIQKLDSIGTLTGGIAHDFNNILTVINGYAQLIISKTDQDTAFYDYANNILHSGERAAELVRKLLAFSRKQIIQPKIININDVIRDVEKILKDTIDEDIDVYLKLSRDILPIKADFSQVEQLLINLITNARDAVNIGESNIKSITIKTENKYIGESFKNKHPSLQKSQYICLTIEDNGVGMDEITLKKIFDPFFTTKPAWMGTGLGLSTVYGIVNQNNGYIDTTSKPGEGTVFKVYWPVTKAVKEYTENLPLPKEGNSLGNGGKILLVEDNETVRDFICHSLSTSGYKVITAEDGLSAIKLLEDKKLSSSIDLIITDIVMPRMGGVELIKRVKEKYPDMKGILITGYTSDRVLNLEKYNNDVFLLHKPFTYKELINFIKNIFV